MNTPYEIIYTDTFSKDIDKLVKSNPSLKKKILNTIEKLKVNPFQGEKVEALNLEQRRIWVGDDHRMFYDIVDNKVVILHLKKKDKHTYKRS